LADPGHLELLRQGIDVWNRWRRTHPRVEPDLSGDASAQFDRDVHSLQVAVLNEVAAGDAPKLGGSWELANLTQANLSRANLTGALLDGAILIEADLSDAHLEGASLSGCTFTGAKLTRASARNADFTQSTLRWADLSDADLEEAVLRRANLDGARAPNAIFREADLFYASLVGADLRGADLSGALVYGVSAWDVELSEATQRDLVITKAGDPPVRVDDLAVAQFLYFLIDNRHVRSVIDTITTKLVLILGRFTPRRKRVLETIREQLRRRSYVPMLFDFDRPASRDFTETVVTLAHLARFIVADLTEPASLPKELEAIIPGLAVPVQPLIQHGHEPYTMFGDYWKYDWVLGVNEYRGVQDLRRSFDDRVVNAAEAKAAVLLARRQQALLPS
jgi:hypothetical protein